MTKATERILAGCTATLKPPLNELTSCTSCETTSSRQASGQSCTAFLQDAILCRMDGERETSW